MKFIKFAVAMVMLVYTAQSAIAQAPPASMTFGPGENYSEVNQVGALTSALVNQKADDGSQNDSFVNQIGPGGLKDATIQQNGTDNVNYSYVNQVGPGVLNTASVTQRGTDNENFSDLRQDGVGRNSAFVRQGLDPSSTGASHNSIVRQTSIAGFSNTVNVDQDGVSGTTNNSDILQMGESNSADVIQDGTLGANGITNTSTVTQTGSGGTAYVNQEN